MNGPLYNFANEEGVPAFRPSPIEGHERFLNSNGGPQKVAYDPDYIAYLRVAYGRALRNCWLRDYRGQERRIDRVFSYAGKDDLKGESQRSWRHGGDIRLDYSVLYFESLMPNWHEIGVLVPFAGVEVHESAEYDMLCFHFQFIPKPAVVLWEHEENGRGHSVDFPSDLVHFVAKDFAEFTKLVFEKDEAPTRVRGRRTKKRDL